VCEGKKEEGTAKKKNGCDEKEGKTSTEPTKKPEVDQEVKK